MEPIDINISIKCGPVVVEIYGESNEYYLHGIDVGEFSNKIMALMKYIGPADMEPPKEAGAKTYKAGSETVTQPPLPMQPVAVIEEEDEDEGEDDEVVPPREPRGEVVGSLRTKKDKTLARFLEAD